MPAKFNLFNLVKRLATFTLDKRGFTLIEILVAIGIIAVVSAVTIPGLRNFNRGEEVNQAKSALVDDLRLAKSKADSGIVCPGVPPNSASLQITYSIILYSTYYETKYECITGVPQVLTATVRKNYPVSSSVTMSALPAPCDGTNTNGTAIKFTGLKCPVNSTQCKSVEIICGDNTSTYTSLTPFAITLTNNVTPAVTKIINITQGGTIYAN